MIRDFRLALRVLGRSPGFTVAAVATLALCLGATTLVFSLVDAVVMRPLPFGERTDRLFTVHSVHPTQAPDWDDSLISYADLIDFREGARSLERIEGVFDRNVSLTGPEESERVLAASITPGLFAVLGVEPQAGRFFREDEGAEPGFESVVLVSHGLWQRRLGADQSILGSTITVNGRALTVVGVMPRGFAFPERHELWLPYAGRRGESRAERHLLGVALVRPGVARADAADDLGTVASDLAAHHPATNRDWGVHLLGLREFFVPASTSRALSLMLGAVGLVLLVGCANIAGLFLVRGVGRQRELAVRAALGAGRATLVRLLLAESLVLGLAGGLFGILVAAWGLDALLAAFPEPPPYWAEPAIDPRVLAFAAAVSVVTGLVCGVLPALRASRLDVAAALGGTHRGGVGASRQRRLQAVLVVGQVAVSLALLVGANLLVLTVQALHTADAGFDHSRLLSLRLYLAGDAYDDQGVRARAIRDAVARVAVLPGVQAAAATGAIPADDGGQTVRVVSDRGSREPGSEMGVQMVPVTPQLWDTLAIPVLDGRTFTDSEAEDPAAAVAIVNRRLAARFWPGDSAVDRQIGVVYGTTTRWLRVVGVVPDLVYEEFGEETEPSKLNVYVPYARAGWRTLALLARTPGDPAALGPAVRRTLGELDPGVAVFDVMTMAERRRMTTWGQRFLGQGFGTFAVEGLLLACLGAYGLVAYASAMRTREVGLRIALGASPPGVLWLFLGQGLRLAAFGFLVGLPLAIGAARLLESLLYGVSPWQMSAWLMPGVMLLGALLLASYVPARRASLVDPADALRRE